MGIIEITVILGMIVLGLVLLLYPSQHQRQMRRERRHKKHGSH